MDVSYQRTSEEHAHSHKRRRHHLDSIWMDVNVNVSEETMQLFVKQEAQPAFAIAHGSVNIAQLEIDWETLCGDELGDVDVDVSVVVTADQVRNQPPNKKSTVGFQVGDSVYSRAAESVDVDYVRWYKATVATDNGNGTWDITYDKGGLTVTATEDQVRNVPSNQKSNTTSSRGRLRRGRTKDVRMPKYKKTEPGIKRVCRTFDRPSLPLSLPPPPPMPRHMTMNVMPDLCTQARFTLKPSALEAEASTFVVYCI